MAKTTSIYVRTDPELKEQAESILEELGIPMSNAVNMFLKQVVMQRGIPFEVKLPDKKPVVIEDLSQEELNKELGKGYDDYLQGNTESIESSFANKT